ncbi:MAG TPA: hypothetical protein VFO41_02945 [Alphaproteobacteria bacterium]|nr:hypothetical protein [Alphaproteobacteria bacterium]
MKITTGEELEQAVQEYGRLKDAAENTPDADRRDELNAAISRYYLDHKDELRKAKPEHRE